ncbi:MAG: hypothetical protein IT376_12430 [Polyangiaceae bacterium]|nr:hypothetical protein [Polyangiaceae bacterium]
MARGSALAWFSAACGAVAGCAVVDDLDRTSAVTDSGVEAGGGTFGGGGSGGGASGGSSGGGSGGGVVGGGSSGGSSGAGPGGGGSGGGAPSGGGAGGSSAFCVPGAQVACACPGGAQGAQACKPDGSGYEPCDCPSASGGAASGGAASGGAASGGAASGGAASGGSGGSAGADSLDTCPGEPLVLAGAVTTVNGSTSGMGADYEPWACSPNGGGRDVVYRFVAPTTGTLTITGTPTGTSLALYYSADTCALASPADCERGISVGDVVVLTIAVTAGTTYYLGVDNYSTAVSGAFSLAFELS